MRILALDAALASCAVAVWADGDVPARLVRPGGRGHSAVLAGMVADALAQAGLEATALDAVAVTVGPGSFTGLRAAIALAQGLGAGLGVPVLGVTLAEALALQANDPAARGLGGRSLWVAIDSRRGRVFLDRGGELAAFALDALPAPGFPVALAGDAAVSVAVRLLAAGHDVMLTDLRLPDPAAIAAIGAARLAGMMAPLPALPLYVDAPEAKLPQGGLRGRPSG